MSGTRGPSRSVQAVVTMVGWWVCVATPTVLVLAGVFDTTPTTPGGDINIPADLTIVWIVSYLGQLALILVLSKPVGHLQTWWIFIASLLPWAVNWAGPYGVGLAVGAVAVSAGVAGAIAMLALDTIKLDEHGRMVWATVVRELPSRFTTVVNNIYVSRKIEFDIPAQDGATYRANLSMLCEIGTRPTVGDRYQLRVDPDNAKRIALAGTATEESG